MVDTQTRIIREAIRYFADNDYDRATLDDIVKAIGVTKGAVYHYFRNKEDLFRAAVTHVMDSLEEFFGDFEEVDVSIEDALDSMFRIDQMIAMFGRATGVESLDEYLNLYSLFLAAMKKFPEIGERMAASYSVFLAVTAEKLRQAKAAGLVDPQMDEEAIAFLLCGFGEGAMLLGAIVPGVDITDIGSRAFEALKRCLFRTGGDAAGGPGKEE